VKVDDEQDIMANILYAKRVSGDGSFLNVSLVGVSSTTGAGLTPRQPTSAGVAIPLSNIAGWQTFQV
jgi:hypothetical protein